jgi:hypothetical protein
MLMKNRDDDCHILLAHEVGGVWKMVEQRAAYNSFRLPEIGREEHRSVRPFE